MIQYESLRKDTTECSEGMRQVRVTHQSQCYALGCRMTLDAIKGILTDASPLCVIHLGLALNSFYRLPCGIEEPEEQAASKGKVSASWLYASALTFQEAGQAAESNPTMSKFSTEPCSANLRAQGASKVGYAWGE